MYESAEQMLKMIDFAPQTRIQFIYEKGQRCTELCFLGVEYTNAGFIWLNFLFFYVCADFIADGAKS